MQVENIHIIESFQLNKIIRNFTENDLDIVFKFMEDKETFTNIDIVYYRYLTDALL